MPKTADIARDIAKWFFQVDGPQQDDCTLKIAAALTAARDEALELGAEEAEEHNGCVDAECFTRKCAGVIASRLRALKSAKQGGK